MKKIYLACPYSHPDEKVRLRRFELANKMAGILMSEGNAVFSPISHSHSISLHLDNSLVHDFWLEQDRAFMNWADEMVVLAIIGWEESRGVSYEIGYMDAKNKPIHYRTF